MTILTGTLLIIGGFLAMGLLCWGLLWLERRAPVEDYDERQKQARGSAYRISFWLGIIYYFCIATFGAMDGDPNTFSVMVMGGIVVQILAFHLCCLLTHASLPLSRKPMAAVAVCGLFAVKHLTELFMAGFDFQTPLHEGALLKLMCGVSFALLAVIHLIQARLERKEE